MLSGKKSKSIYRYKTKGGEIVFGWFLVGAVAAALASGSASSEEDYCNQHGCNYDDIYERRRVRSDDDMNDQFVCWADDDD